MGHEAAEGDAPTPEAALTSRARGEFPKVWQCLGEAADGSGSPLLYSQTPLNHHLPEARCSVHGTGFLHCQSPL